MAAGEGKRLNQLTHEFPKALIDVKGKSLISYSLDQITEIIKEVYITVGYEKEKVTEYLLHKKEYKIIDTTGKGNAWWIFNTIFREIDEPVLVLPCDLITHLDISFIMKNYRKREEPACFLVPVVPVDGIDCDYIYGKEGIVYSLSREKKSALYCSGIQVLNPNKIYRLCKHSDNFTELWSILIENKMLYYSDIYPYYWYSINTELQLMEYNAHSGETVPISKNKQYRYKLWKFTE
jgi:MurNAc alpha-1-phosphate uridylyltransferase